MFGLTSLEIKYDVFLSYSRTDAPWAERMAGRLRREGCSVWLDAWIPRAGGAWRQQAILGLDKARSIAICLGREMPVAWLGQRLSKAFGRQEEDPTFRILPVLAPDATALDRDGFARVGIWADFRRGSDEGLAFQVLLCAVRGQPIGRWPPPEPRAGEETTLAQQVASAEIPVDSPFHAHLRDLLEASEQAEARGSAGGDSRQFRHDLFLSYSQADLPAVWQLAPRLADAGLRLWFGPWRLVPGAPWQEEVANARNDSATIAVCLGSRGRPRADVRFAPGGGSGTPGLRGSVIPLLLPGSSPGEIPPELSGEVPVDFRYGLRDPVALRRLLAAAARSSCWAPAPTASEIAGRLLCLGDPEGALPYYGKAAKEAGRDDAKLARALNDVAVAREAAISAMPLRAESQLTATLANEDTHDSVS